MSDLNISFDADAALYEQYRPSYPQKLFLDIFSYSDLKLAAEILEIGIGTGQATEPFLDAGCKVSALEPGKNLSAFAREKFKKHSNFTLFESSFEEFLAPENFFDLVFTATSFHWIPENIACAKTKTLLRPGGVVALFWNRPFVAKTDDPLHRKIQSIYAKLRPLWRKPEEIETQKHAARKNMLTANGFSDILFKLYHRQRFFSADNYIALLNTYSDHRSMDNVSKISLERAIHQAILEFDKHLTIYDTIDLYLGRKK